ncbi:MAG: hypothetical protein J6A00_10030 [Bacteroides sp.]|uniref:hypothetical protein n=1 Tax=Phocaeicola sartorii TaxID=671267 RepID=UPI001B0A7DAC|nr:hypothetical protein [Phocaeicola sartorii]MBO5508082.1 hypothetical protein [Bacteroides sp.]
MNRILITILLFSIAVAGVSQKPRLLLFEHFKNGTVLMKNRAKTSAQFNYDTANRQMLFKQGGETMIMTNIELVDTIYIGSRTFFPAGRSLFLEAVSLKNGTIYINWILKKQLKGKKGAYGQISQANVETINTSYWTNTKYKNESADIYSLSNENEYWLKHHGKFVKCKNEKSLLKLFPGKESLIKKFIKENKINFHDTEQVIYLLNYCLEITKDKV